MKLGEFINYFSHNNLIRLVYRIKGGHEPALLEWKEIDMDWKINKGQGKFRHYINNEVLGLASIYCADTYPETINIIIERLENQPIIEEIIPEHTPNCNTVWVDLNLPTVSI